MNLPLRIQVRPTKRKRLEETMRNIAAELEMGLMDRPHDRRLREAASGLRRAVD